MSISQDELFPLLEKFIKRGKVRFPGGGVMVIENKLENLLLLIEALEEEGIPVRDNLGSYYLREGCIFSKTVKLRISGKRARLFPGESF